MATFKRVTTLGDFQKGLIVSALRQANKSSIIVLANARDELIELFHTGAVEITTDEDDADYDDNGNLRAGCDHNEMEPIHAAADARFEAGSPTLRDGDDYND